MAIWVRGEGYEDWYVGYNTKNKINITKLSYIENPDIVGRPARVIENEQ